MLHAEVPVWHLSLFAQFRERERQSERGGRGRMVAAVVILVVADGTKSHWLVGLQCALRSLLFFDFHFFPSFRFLLSLENKSTLYVHHNVMVWTVLCAATKRSHRRLVSRHHDIGNKEDRHPVYRAGQVRWEWGEFHRPEGAGGGHRDVLGQLARS